MGLNSNGLHHFVLRLSTEILAALDRQILIYLATVLILVRWTIFSLICLFLLFSFSSTLISVVFHLRLGVNVESLIRKACFCPLL